MPPVRQAAGRPKYLTVLGDSFDFHALLVGLDGALHSRFKTGIRLLLLVASIIQLIDVDLLLGLQSIQLFALTSQLRVHAVNLRKVVVLEVFLRPVSEFGLLFDM